MKQFELRFEGPKDESPSTLRQIKGVFVADLEFPIADVQRFIENAPVVIKKAATEEDLNQAFNLLENAGAKVLIVHSQTEAEPSPLELEFEEVLVQPTTELVNTEHEITPLALEFDLETEPAIQESPQETKSFFNSIQITDDTASPADDNLNFQLTEDDNLSVIGSLEIQAIEEDPKSKIDNNDLKNNSDNEFELDLFQPENSTLLGSTDSENPAIEPEVEIQKPEKELVQEEAVSPAATLPYPAAVPEPTEDLKEFTADQLKALQAPIKKKKINLRLWIAFSICLLVLVYLNSILLKPAHITNPFDSIIDSLPKISTDVDPKKQQQELADKAAAAAATSWHTAEGIFPDRSFKATAWIENKLPVHVSIEVTTPKPAPLSKEEIVNNLPERVWLKRIEIKDIIFKKIGEKYRAEGPALAYMYATERNIRLTGKAIVEASVNQQTGELSMSVKAGTDLGAASAESSSQPSNPAATIRFSLAGKNASDSDNFFYTENILIQ